MSTKIVIFFIATISLFSLSCENYNIPSSSIPNIRMNITIGTLNIPELQSPLTPKYIDAINGQKIGYNGHGIYVIRITKDEFRAFDASCSFEGNNEISHSEIKEHILPVASNPILVYCPKCKSVFNLLDGNPQKGVAKKPLKQYSTIISGNTVRIYN